jgi:hypothetical protein
MPLRKWLRGCGRAVLAEFRPAIAGVWWRRVGPGHTRSASGCWRTMSWPRRLVRVRGMMTRDALPPSGVGRFAGWAAVLVSRSLAGSLAGLRAGEPLWAARRWSSAGSAGRSHDGGGVPCGPVYAAGAVAQVASDVALHLGRRAPGQPTLTESHLEGWHTDGGMRDNLGRSSIRNKHQGSR